MVKTNPRDQLQHPTWQALIRADQHAAQASDLGKLGDWTSTLGWARSCAEHTRPDRGEAGACVSLGTARAIP